MATSVFFRRASSVFAATTMALFGFTGMASAQTITNTGPGSTNTITSSKTANCIVTNNNVISATNSNSQTAVTGEATVSDNTSALWNGWAGLDPAAAQAGGASYASWWNGVVDWLGQRSNGDGWNSNNAQLSWSPGSGDWSAYDPMLWQMNGQSFTNWWQNVSAYMNNGGWILTWPTDANGNAFGAGATSGDATNTNETSIVINIDNSLKTLPAQTGNFPDPACGSGNMPITPVTPPTGGKGGGGSWVTPSYAPMNSGRGGYSSTYYPRRVSAPAQQAVAQHTPPTPSTPVQPVTPPVPPTPTPTPASSISNTGPGSTNTITNNQNSNVTVTNNNTVSVINMNSQSASSGDASNSGNTSTGSGGSGGANNANGTGADVGIAN